MERFVNLCHNHEIILWDVSYSKRTGKLHFKIGLRDFYRLRPISRKSKVFLVVKYRYGFPFFIQEMKKQKNFFGGIVVFLCILLFLSTRIWGITVEGESYHTKETLLRFLDTKQIYGGMEKKSVICSDIEEMIRERYRDIGWVSVELRGTRLIVRIREIQLITKKSAKEPASLVAQEDGIVKSIVTQRGTAKVKEGKRVKKGDILISGKIKIKGDSEEVIKTKYVRAKGKVVLERKEFYQDSLKKEYQKRIYTGRSKKIYRYAVGEREFFLHNPLNYLETYKKYDILYEGGQLCPFLSLRFPIASYTKTFREYQYQKRKYSQKEAEAILKERFQFFLSQQRKEGFVFFNPTITVRYIDGEYRATGELVYQKVQKGYKIIKRKNEIGKTDGTIRNKNGNTDRT